MRRSSFRGFTLVEIIVVIVVISILLAIVSVFYTKIQAQARDQKRKTDVMLFVDSAEKYYDKNGEYPTGCSQYYAAQGKTSCSLATGVTTDGDGIYQDTTGDALRAVLPLLPADFGDPRGDETRPFRATGQPGASLLKYVYWGQLDATSVNSNRSALFGGQYTIIDCGLPSSDISVGFPTGPLPKQTAFFIAYHSESEDKFYIYQGKHGNRLIDFTTGAPVQGTLGKCTFVNS